MINNLAELYLSNMVYEGYRNMKIYFLAGIILILIIKDYNQQKVPQN